MRACFLAAILVLFAATADAKSAAKAHHMQATAYCQSGTTSSGAPTREGIVAADPAVLPLGTAIHIDSPRRYSGVYLVADTGAAVKGRIVDIYMPDCAAAKRFGRRRVTVTVLHTRVVEKLAEKD